MRALRVAPLLALAPACAASPDHAPPRGAEERPAEGPSWTDWAQLYAYVLPDDPDYVVPVVAADRGALHLEARYGYEDRETASVWVGWNLSSEAAEEGELELGFTPMLGAVFGLTDGIAPGYRLSLGLGSIELESEGEYLVDFDGREGNYFYSWTELAYAAGEQLSVGLALQRTRVFDTERELDLGLLLGLASGAWSFTSYFFEPWDEERFFVLAAGFAP